jgi:uncharacterized protein YndB with AHSA1/START domain
MAADVAHRNDMQIDRVSDRELVITRTFDAPARIVYTLWTTPEHMKRWWAPKAFGVTMYECDNDVRVGGKFRYVFGKDGQPRMAFSGVFTEVVPNARLVTSQLFEQMPQAGEAIVTTTFVEHGTQTRLELRQLFATKAALDGAVASGMTDGMKLTFDQLAELAATPR